MSFFFFFFNDTATTEIYTLSLHDALPIFYSAGFITSKEPDYKANTSYFAVSQDMFGDLTSLTLGRSEEHTSELQSRSDLVCRLLLEKKKHNATNILVSLDHPVESRPTSSS